MDYSRISRVEREPDNFVCLHTPVRVEHTFVATGLLRRDFMYPDCGLWSTEWAGSHLLLSDSSQYLPHTGRKKINYNHIDYSKDPYTILDS